MGKSGVESRNARSASVSEGGAWLDTPPGLADAYGDWGWHLAWQYEGHSVVYSLSRPGAPELFLKLQPAGEYPSLPAEAQRMRWAHPYLPVPSVVGMGCEGDTEWLATTRIRGVDGTHPDLVGDPERLTRMLATGLRRVHERTPVRGCPFDFRLDAALARARKRLNSGLGERGLDFHPEFRHLSGADALDVLEATRPDSEDLVVCHGDYCPPNVLIEGGRAVGYLDLGEMGVACRWWDLAVATWSITWNLGEGYEELFLSTYGATPDAERIVYYRLMYDAVS